MLSLKSIHVRKCICDSMKMKTKKYVNITYLCESIAKDITIPEVTENRALS